jgi:carbon starvation protein
VTLAPLVTIVAITFSASWHKIFNPNPRIGFLAHARLLASGPATADTAKLIFNDRLDAVVTGLLVVLVAMIVTEAVIEWTRILSGRKIPTVTETPFVPTSYAPGALAVEEAQ